MTKLIKKYILSTHVSNYTLYRVIQNFPGIGMYKTRKILILLGFSVNNLHKKMKDLSEIYKEKLYVLIMSEIKNYKKPIHQMLSTKTYKNYRYIHNLPLRGQRTKTNAQTRKKWNKKK